MSIKISDIIICDSVLENAPIHAIIDFELAHTIIDFELVISLFILKSRSLIYLCSSHFMCAFFPV